jgi:hypothetical protein
MRRAAPGRALRSISNDVVRDGGITIAQQLVPIEARRTVDSKPSRRSYCFGAAPGFEIRQRSAVNHDIRSERAESRRQRVLFNRSAAGTASLSFEGVQ